MKRKNWICLSSAVVLTAALLPLPWQLSSADSAKSDDIVILYTNDVHCAADTNIGYGGLALYKHELEAQYDHVFTVDAGDAIQGAPLGTATEGKDIISLMNAVGYDVCIPGNHEFDFGMDVFKERSKELKCGYISCNITDLEKDQLLLDPYKIVEAGDKKIAFVGVTTPETILFTAPSSFQEEDGTRIYSFGEKDDAVIKLIQDGVDAARKEDPDYVILLSHLGEKDSKESWRTSQIVSGIRGVDAVIDAHSHEEIASEELKDADGKTVLVTQTGTKLQKIGQMTISDDGKITTQLVDSVPEPEKKLDLPEDSWKKLDNGKFVDTKVQECLDEINEKLNERFAEKIGESPFKLYDSDPETGKRRVRSGETNLGNLCADAYRAVMDTDVAIVNGGGLRSFIEAGDITLREAMAVQPYNNTICAAEVTGQQILDILERGAENYPEESSSFIHVSGMTYAIDPDAESTIVTDENGDFVEVTGERRVHSVMIGDEPLDPEKTYTLASHDYYLKNGGDNRIFSGKCTILREGPMSDTEVTAVYIRDILEGVVPESYRDPYGEGRIRSEKKPDAEKPTEETTDPTEETTEAVTDTTEPVTETTEPVTETTETTADPTEPTTDTTEPATETTAASDPTEPTTTTAEPTTQPTTEPTTEPTTPGFQIPPELLAILQQMGITEEDLQKLDWSKLPENPSMEDYQKFLTEQLSPGDQELGENGLPEGLDPSMFPEGFDYTKVDWSKFPPGFDWSSLPADFDWNSLLEDSDSDTSNVKPTEAPYVVPFLLTPRPFLKATPVTENEHKSYDYISSVSDASGSRTTAEDDETPYTGERTAAGAAAAAAVLAVLTAAAVRRKHR
jgi:2',3'-cyclic-nucleotide 2'-phosphodiesterase (5'-nucleotidase family)